MSGLFRATSRDAQGYKAHVSIIAAFALDVDQAAHRPKIASFKIGFIVRALAIISTGGLNMVTSLVVDAAEAATSSP